MIANTSAPARCRAVRLDARTTAAIISLHQRGLRAQLEVTAEVIELVGGCRALLWIHDRRRGGPGRLRACRLTAAQWAEAALAIEEGLRPVFHISFEVLGRRGDGSWSVATHESHVQMEALRPEDDGLRLEELLN